MKTRLCRVLALLLMLLIVGCASSRRVDSTGDENLTHNTEIELPSVEGMSEEDIIVLYDSYVSGGNYTSAGTLLFNWLNLYQSADIKELLFNIRSMYYTKQYTVTTRDDSGDITDISRYAYDKHDNMIEESYGINNADSAIMYHYEYNYDGNNVISYICTDNSDTIMYKRNYTYNNDNKITMQTSTYDNTGTVETVIHTYDNNGNCIQEVNTYGAIDEEPTTVQVVTYTYNDYGYITLARYEVDGELTQTVQYNYSGEFLNKIDYLDSTGEVYLTYEYMYDSDGNMLCEIITEGEHTESSEYTYNGVGDWISVEYKQHDELVSKTESELDFLGNVIFETITQGDTTRQLTYEYEYIRKE